MDYGVVFRTTPFYFTPFPVMGLTYSYMGRKRGDTRPSLLVAVGRFKRGKSPITSKKSDLFGTDARVSCFRFKLPHKFISCVSARTSS